MVLWVGGVRSLPNESFRRVAWSVAITWRLASLEMNDLGDSEKEAILSFVTYTWKSYSDVSETSDFRLVAEVSPVQHGRGA